MILLDHTNGYITIDYCLYHRNSTGLWHSITSSPSNYPIYTPVSNELSSLLDEELKRRLDEDKRQEEFVKQFKALKAKL